MSASDHASARINSSKLLSLSDLPKKDDGAVFDEPWHAQVFSIVHLLVDKDIFTLSEWAQTLGAVIHERADETEYYECWLSALERLSIEKNLVSNEQLSEQKEAWDRAARATPHGEAIRLGR